MSKPSLLDTGRLADYHLAHVAEADLLRQLGRNEVAKAAYPHPAVMPA
jgi:predicted RNA polymerase sigma factor